MKKSLVPLLGIAFIVAVLTTGVFYGLFSDTLNRKPVPTHQVVVAAKPLPAGHPLRAADLKLASWASPELPAGGFQSLTQTAGLLLVGDMSVGEPLTAHRVVSPRTGAGAGLGIPSGLRAVSVTVLRSPGVVAMLKPGHRVDVQVLNDMGDAHAGRRTTVVRTALQHLTVLRVTPIEDRSATAHAVVTLLAEPAQADLLSLADATAEVRLLLRNPVDESVLATQSLDIAGLARGEAGRLLPVSPANRLPVSPSRSPATLTTPATTRPVSFGVRQPHARLMQPTEQTPAR